MTETNVKKTCDVCGKQMIKDGPIWYGGYVQIEENYSNRNSYPHDKVVIDVCRECLKVVRKMLRLPQFDCNLTPEEQDMVDRTVARMMTK